MVMPVGAHLLSPAYLTLILTAQRMLASWRKGNRSPNWDRSFPILKGPALPPVIKPTPSYFSQQYSPQSAHLRVLPGPFGGTLQVEIK